jgi:hypothetical protein
LNGRDISTGTATVSHGIVKGENYSCGNLHKKVQVEETRSSRS